MKTAYSYLRFSSPEQRFTDSFRRQFELAVKYAKDHDLELDESITFQDLGVSAFTGENRRTGRLGDFLLAIQNGLVEKGSYLLVENLDRISRETARRALRTLEDICDEEITVVTLMDNQVYTAKKLDDDPAALLVSLVIFMRANEELKVRRARLKKAWLNKLRRARQGETLMSKRVPSWLYVKDDKIFIKDEKAKVIQRIFQMRLEGKGVHRIAAIFNQEKVNTIAKAKIWFPSGIGDILRSQATIGIYTPRTLNRSGKVAFREPLEPIVDYYPPIISREDFNQVRKLMALRSKKLRGKTTNYRNIKNVFARLGKCPKCDGGMGRLFKTLFVERIPSVPHFCCRVAEAGGDCNYIIVEYDPLEAVFLAKFPRLLDDMITSLARNNSDEETTPLTGRIREEQILRIKLINLRKSITKESLDRTKFNYLLRRVCSKVVINYPERKLDFHWSGFPMNEIKVNNMIIRDLGPRLRFWSNKNGP